MWNYRLIRKNLTSPDEPWLELHEVFYRREKVWLWTEKPVAVDGASKAEIERALKMMLKDLRHPVLLESELERLVKLREKRKRK